MPSAEMGPVVPQTVEATIYDWKWYYSAPVFAIWLLLALAITIPKSNRKPSVFLIFVPLILVNLAWSLFEKITGMASAQAVQFGTLLQSMVTGIAALWLIGQYFTNFRATIRLLLSFGTVVLVAAFGISSYSTEFSNETTLFLIFIVFLTTTVLVAISLAGTFCRRRYGPRRFMLWLALWMVLFGMIGTLGFRIAGDFIMSSNPSIPHVSEVLVMFFIAGPILGLALYLLNLPFMILGFVNPFFRERLCGCLGLKSPNKTTDSSSFNSIAE